MQRLSLSSFKHLNGKQLRPSLGQNHQLRHLVAVIAKSQNMSYSTQTVLTNTMCPLCLVARKIAGISSQRKSTLSSSPWSLCMLSNKHNIFIKTISPGLWCPDPHEIGSFPFKMQFSLPFQVQKLTSMRPPILER